MFSAMLIPKRSLAHARAVRRLCTPCRQHPAAEASLSSDAYPVRQKSKVRIFNNLVVIFHPVVCHIKAGYNIAGRHLLQSRLSAPKLRMRFPANQREPNPVFSFIASAIRDNRRLFASSLTSRQYASTFAAVGDLHYFYQPRLFRCCPCAAFF